MESQLAVDTFLTHLPTFDTPILDVRSPGEFEQGHIPGAVSFPLFDDEERAIVGTLYKQSGREDAIMRGLDIIGPKMSRFVRAARKLAPARRVRIHCWRGGMRSGSLAWLLQTAGFEASVLTGGYKAYRSYIRSELSKPLNLIVLGGKTGSGKTDILHALTELGEQVIDLEGLAHHKGSSFGALGQLPQPSTEQFENDIHTAFTKLNTQKRIWIEDESHSIGRVYLPAPLEDQMRVAPTIALAVPPSIRINRLVREYATFPKADLIESLSRIQKRLGNQRLQQAITALEQNDYATTAEIALAYYDQAYAFGLTKKPEKQLQTMAINSDNPSQTAQELIRFVQKQAILSA